MIVLFVIAFYLAGVLIIYGWLVAKVGYLGIDDSWIGPDREELGMCLFGACVLGVIPILGVFFAYCFTGFAENGWRLK
jgi:hypothetical protein